MRKPLPPAQAALTRGDLSGCSQSGWALPAGDATQGTRRQGSGSPAPKPEQPSRPAGDVRRKTQPHPRHTEAAPPGWAPRMCALRDVGGAQSFRRRASPKHRSQEVTRLQPGGQWGKGLGGLMGAVGWGRALTPSRRMAFAEGTHPARPHPNPPRHLK